MFFFFLLVLWFVGARCTMHDGKGVDMSRLWRSSSQDGSHHSGVRLLNAGWSVTCWTDSYSMCLNSFSSLCRCSCLKAAGQMLANLQSLSWETHHVGDMQMAAGRYELAPHNSSHTSRTTSDWGDAGWQRLISHPSADDVGVHRTSCSPDAALCHTKNIMISWRSVFLDGGTVVVILLCDCSSGFRAVSMDVTGGQSICLPLHPPI